MKNNLYERRRARVLCVCVTLITTAVFGSLSLAQPPRNHTSDTLIVTVPLLQENTLSRIMDQGITILTVDRLRTSVILSVSSEEYAWLSAMSLAPEIVADELAEMQGWKYSPVIERDFHTYAQMTTALQTIANTYPAITRLYDLGHSVQGRSIWGLKITDNPDAEEDEPEVRICGVHHGHEYMGAELSLLMAQYLSENYGTNTTVTTLVNSREIWVIPIVNPDGRESSTRENANGVDLNRDYGYMWGGSGGSPGPFSQPETQVIRANALANNFVLSLSYHTSAEVVNYVWNYKHQVTPDNAVVVALSNQYSSHNGYWVVEGYDWYQTMGDTNDFSYGCRGDIDWTIETPNTNIPLIWSLHKEAMFDIVKGADLGVRGIVTDAQTGQPVTATIWVQEAYWPCFTDLLVGDYHKPLLPGTYHVIVRANGYQQKESTVDVSAGQPTILNVALNKANEFYAYQVTVAEFYAPSDNFQNNPTEAIAALGPSDESCASLGVGGNMIVDMNENITDRQGAPDFKVYEGDATTDGYFVYGSANWNGPWSALGTGMGTTEFDLANTSMTSVRYIKIVDDGNGNPGETNPGCDIDAIQNLAASDQNYPPYTPDQPAGSTQGQTGSEYTYSTTTIDPEANPVYYLWSWGENLSDWLGPYTSGETVQASHIWSAPNNYSVKVKAKDALGQESGWSEPIIVSIEKSPHIQIGTIIGGFGVTATLENTGAGEATDVHWSIALDGGLVLLGRQTTGTLTKIQPGFSPEIRSGFLFGVGSITITVTADEAEQAVSAFLLGPFVLVKK